MKGSRQKINRSWWNDDDHTIAITGFGRRRICTWRDDSANDLRIPKKQRNGICQRNAFEGWPGDLGRWGGQSYRNQHIRQNFLAPGHRRCRTPWFPAHPAEYEDKFICSPNPVRRMCRGRKLVIRREASVTLPVSMMTPIELSSLASSNARLSSFTVRGRKAFRLSGRFMVICRPKMSRDR
jgi:hypothetical protein